MRGRTGALRLACGLCCGIAVLLAPRLAPAHGRSTSTSAFEIEDGDGARARITVRASYADLQRAIPELAALAVTPESVGPEATAFVDRYLQDHVLLRSGGEACPVVGATLAAPSADPTHIGRRWQVLCASSDSLAVESTAFFEVQPAHLQLARIRRGNAPVVEAVLVLDRPRIALVSADAGVQVGSGLLDYVKLGIEHIFSGTDHLCFVLALLLIGATLGEVATVVTGFTAAHSVTLALGVLGVVRPASAAVEALIGLSIVVVALENFFETTAPATRALIRRGLLLLVALAVVGALGGIVAVPWIALVGLGLFSLCYFALLARAERPARLRWLVAFVFGLVHGFGFAGVLAETALPAGRTAQALLGFNLGVELGQLCVVLAIWPLYRLVLARRPELRVAVIQAGSAFVLAAGLFWFLTRGLGGA